MIPISEVLEEAALAVLAQRSAVVQRHPARVEFDPDNAMAEKCAAAIRALKDKYGNAILCEQEPACVLSTSNEIHTPLYRAKEPTK
jgi:hypothetical protein